MTNQQKNQLLTLNVCADGPVVIDGNAFTIDPNGHLIIGGGGRGMACVALIKRLIMERVGYIDPKLVRFLVFDTGRTDIATYTEGTEDSRLKFGTEVLDINKCENLRRSLTSQVRPAHIEKLLPKDLNVGEITSAMNGLGASKTRLIGKLYFMDAETQNKITAALAAAAQTFTNPPTIHIIMGSGGGTGSGVGLDLAYLVRSVFPKSKNIFGHVMLADSYDEFEQIADKSSLLKNSYAFIKEMDYYMTAIDINEPYKLDLGGGNIRTSDERVFSICTVYGGSVNEGVGVASRTAASNKACAEFILNMVSGMNVVDGTGTPIAMVDSVIANMNQAGYDNATILRGNPAVAKDRAFVYCAVGVSLSSLPMKEIASLAIGKALIKTKRIMEINRNSITNDVAEQFTKDRLITPKTLAESLKASKEILYSGYVTDVTASDLSHNRVTTLCTNASAQCANDVKSGATLFASKTTDIVEEFEAACRDAFTDHTRGPLYLKDILTGVTRGSLSFKGFEHALNNLVTECTNVISELNAEIGKEQTKMASAVAHHRRRDVPTYKEAFVNYYCATYARDMLQMFINSGMFSTNTVGSAAASVKKKIATYKDLADTIVELESIFERDAVNANKAFQSADNDTSIFAYTDASVRELSAATYRKLVADYDNDDAATRLYTALTKAMVDDPDPSVYAPDKWLDINALAQTSNAKTARKFFGEQFSSASNVGDILNLKLLDVMEHACANQPAGAYGTLIRDIYKNLSVKARKMLSIDAAFANCCTVVNCIRPAPTTNWAGAFANAQGVFTAEGINVIPANSSDERTLSAINVMYALPLYAWTGLKEAKEEYERNYASTLHTDGSAETNWFNRPSPYSINVKLEASYVDDKHTRIHKEMKALFEQGEQIGAITCTGSVIAGQPTDIYSAYILRKDLYRIVNGKVVLDAALLQAIKSYCDAKDVNGIRFANLDETGSAYKKGAHLFQQVLVPFLDANIPQNVYALTTYGTLIATTKEDAINVFRCRSVAHKAVEYALEVYKAVCDKVDEYGRSVVDTAKARNFAQYYRNDLIRMTKQPDKKGVDRPVFQYRTTLDGEWITYWKLFEDYVTEKKQPYPDELEIYKYENLPTYCAFERFYRIPNIAEITEAMAETIVTDGNAVRQGGAVDAYNDQELRSLLINAIPDATGKTVADYIAIFYRAMAATQSV